MDHKWTIEQLTALVEKALKTVGYDGQNSGRVRSVPDLRTIRYYTTLGLLDPPAEMRGRKAYYGRRHMLQLVAIKRLQSRGLSLVQVQQAMAGANDVALSRLADLPKDFWDRVPEILPSEQSPPTLDAMLAEPAPRVPGPPPSSSRSLSQFWAAAPALPKAPESSEPVTVERQQPRAAVHLPVADGVELVIEGIGAGQLDRVTLDRLSPVLGNLAQTLRDLRLTPAPPQPKGPAGSETSSSSNRGK